MVVFTCNACSSVLKRNQVDKHCYSCRRCESLSCVDCGKDFWGDEYLQHIKCITEEEKYCGKGVVPKVNKGEAKQEQWVEQVQSAIEKSSSNPKLKGLLVQLQDYPNIPRKKAKFENFVKNSLRVHNTSLVAEIWNILMESRNENGKPQTTEPKGQQSTPDSTINGSNDTEAVDTVNEDVKKETQESAAPKNKREKKEERRKKGEKKEKKDKQVDSVADEGGSKKLKGKKRKRDESGEESCEENSEPEHSQSSTKNKKKKKQNDGENNILTENGNEEENEVEEEEEDEEAPPTKRKKVKFNWEQVVKTVLEQKGELSLKKLKKKILNEYAAQDGSNYNEVSISAKFDKKVLKMPGVKVHKERASLKTSR